MAHLEGAYEQVNHRLASIDGRLDNVERKIDAAVRSLDAKIDSRFTWTIGVVFGSWLTTILAVFLRH
jgi:tetrahydromethanopterin S-methyltransferase subunit G